MHEEDSEQCRDEEERYTDKHRENDLQDTAITRSKLSSDQIEMKTHPKESEENIDIGECLGEAQISRCLLITEGTKL